MLPDFKLFHLNPTTSDHVPILLEWATSKKMRGRKLFRYEDGWNIHDGCTEAVIEGWQTGCSGSLMFQVTKKNQSHKSSSFEVGEE